MALLILLFAVIPVTEMLAVRLFSGIITDGPGQFAEDPRRVLGQIVVFFIALAATGTVGWWGWLGVIPLLTGVVRFCPLYSLVGMNTCPMKARK